MGAWAMSSENWPEVRLGDLVSIKHGWPFKGTFFAEDLTGRPVVVNIGNFQYTGGFRFESTTVKEYRGEYPLEYELRPGDILLVMTCQTSGGEILGIPGRVPDDGRTYLHNQRIGRVIVDCPDVVDDHYLYWLFLSPAFNRELATTATGSKILHTSPSRIEAFRFRLPSLPEQRRIAGTLDSLQDKIELNRHMSRTLESIARAIFRSWFVDFDPVRNRGEGGEVGLSPDLVALFPDSLVNTDYGLMPDGWSTATLEDVAHQVRDQVQPAEMRDETPFIGLEHLPRRSIALREWGAIDGVVSAKSRFGAGDILFGKLRPYFHKVGPAPVDGACSTDIVVVRPCHADLGAFVLGHLSSDDFVSFAAAGSKGTRMPRTSWKDMAAYPLLLPPEQVLGAYQAMVQPLLRRIQNNIFESRALVSARELLLPQLLTGRLPVEDARRGNGQGS